MPLHRRLAALLLCLALATAGACSLLKMSYNRAPALTYWWLDGYLDFDATQKPVMQRALARLHAWHYVHELPAYLHLLDDLQQLVNETVTPEQVCRIVDRVRGRALALNTQAASITMEIAPSLTARQLLRLAQKFEDRNEDWREDWMEGTLKERQAYRLKQAIKRARYLYGSVEDAQEALLSKAIAESSFDPEVSYAAVLQREHAALDLLHAIAERRLAGNAAAAAITQFYDTLLTPQDPAYASYIRTLTLESCRLIAEFHNTTTPAQRQHAAERLHGYRDDLSSVRAPVTP